MNLIIAAAYLIIMTSDARGGVTAIPYKSMEECKIAENQANEVRFKGTSWPVGYSYCILGSK